jgi:hypothetical protein
LPRTPAPLRTLLVLLLTVAATHARSQQPATTAPSTTKTVKPDSDLAEIATALAAADDALRVSSSISTNDAGASGIVPYRRGFNGTLVTTSQHDSAGGWASFLTPFLAFRFNRHFSVFATVPVYSYINIYTLLSTTPATKTQPAIDNYGFRKRNFLLGDTTLSGQYETHFRPFDYSLTTTLGTPIGDDDNGLGAGQPTYNFNNHFERPVGDRFTPELELGIGNSPNLVDSRVRKTYTDVGTNAHFQAGFAMQLPFKMSFETQAFEELPLSTQTFTSTTTNGKKGKELKTITTTTNKSAGEDNGFINTLDIPLNPHLTLSGFYNRSLRNRIDTAGFSLTFLLKTPPHSQETTR